LNIYLNYVVIFSVYSPDGIHWLRSSLNNFLQASESQEVDKKEINELFGNVSTADLSTI